MTSSALAAPSVDTLTEQGVTFFRFHLVKNGVDPASAAKAVAKGSDRYLLVRYVATSLGLILANERAREDATLPDSATGDDLVRLAAIYKITPSAGAGATGPVVVTCAGSVTVPEGTECTSASNQKRYRVVTTRTVTTGDTVDVVGLDVGKSTELDPGTALRWDYPPGGLAQAATVGSAGLRNGLDPDTNVTLRRRLSDRLARLQNGGSWAHVKAWAERLASGNATGVEAAYVYPALQGPATEHVAVTIAGTAANRYSRVASSALVALVNSSILAQSPGLLDLTTTSVTHQPLEVVLRVTAPGTVGEGAAGGGWVDPAASRWPVPATPTGVVTIDTVESATAFLVAGMSAAASAGASVQFWDSTNLVVRSARVVTAAAISGGTAAITIDTPFPTLLAGDYLFPALVQGQRYAGTFQGSVAALAPGEKTADAVVLRRGYRHPSAAQGAPASALTSTQMTALQNAFPELSNVQYARLDGGAPVLPYAPAAPSSPALAPRVFRVQKLAFYPQ